MTDLNVQIQSSTLPNVQAKLEKTTAEAREIQMPEALKAQYAYLEKLGKGSQGQVWLAERKSDGERVAIKQLNVHSVTTWKQYELFKREAGILESLNFEGVVPFYEYVEDLEAKPPFVCIVQKYIEGQTLAEMLKAKHRFETDAIYDIIAQVLRILQKLHTHQPPVVHRDIKPSNLMLIPKENGRYQVTLLDFGAVANPQVQNGGSTVAGTFGYMPPEQLMGQAQPASDIYALAALAVELLSGTSPADIPVCDFKLVIEPHLSHVPIEVVQTLSMMLEPAMDNRICDHTALIAQFDALANKKQPSLLHFLRRTAVPKLEDVESICQPGNYEIWQNLDQKTDIALSKCPCHLDIPKAKDHIQAPDALIFTSNMLVLWIILAISGFIACCMDMDKMSAGYSIALLILSLILSIVTGVSYLSQKEKFDNQFKLDCPNDLPKLQLTDDNLENFQLLIRHGQKVIGQITAIYYLNSAKKYTVDLFEPENGMHQISFDIPKFWVIYRFQYRDAQNLEFYGDLVTHMPPEGHYKVGDPITCMADISPLDDKHARLSVVPYPYPFGDVMNQDEILFSCDMDNKVLNNGDVMECDKQLELYCLSSIPYVHDKNNDDVVEIIPGKHLNYPTAMEFYKKLAEQLKQRYGDDEAILKAAGIYRFHLDDKESTEELARPLLKQCKQRFESGDDEAILKAAEIYRDILTDDIEYTNCHRLFAKRYLPKPDANADEMESAIENYQSKLKYESERICWEMIVIIWMDDYGLTIEEIWDKLKASYGSIPFRDFEYSMFTAFSYFNEDWLKAHQFDPKKAEKHIRGFGGTYEDHDMKYLREIWEYKKKYQNGDKEAAFNLYNNYSTIFYAYSDAKIWAQRYYDADPSKYRKKYIIECDEEIQSTIQKFYKDMAEPLQQRHGDEEAILKAAEIYRDKLNDHQSADALYQIKHYMAQIKAGDDEAILKAAEIYRDKLKDKQSADKLYLQLIEHYTSQFKSGDEEAILKAAEIYRDKLKDKQSADKLYHQLIEHYTSQFKAGDDEAILKAAEIYRDKLKDKQSADALYQIKHYTSQFKAGDDEAILKAAENYRDIADDIEYTNCHRLFAKRYLPKPDANTDEMTSAIKNYQSKLKYESERICWEMIVMIWMDDYGLRIEKIWDKLKASDGSIHYSNFEDGMFTAFSYFNEDWLKAHQFDPVKAYKHIRSLNGTYDDHHMKNLREIWKDKKKYQNGDNKAAFDLYLNYSIHFEAYSDAKIWALRHYDADPSESKKKYIIECDKEIRRLRGKAL